ncbi:unnamed protein product [Scytosiphon promiscuus]
MPQKHAKNNCASKCFNHWERNEAASDGHYGTRKVRLGGDSQQTFGHCCLCIHPAVEPMATPSGHVYCKECIVEYLLAKTQELKRQREAFEAQEKSKATDEVAADASRKVEATNDFMSTQQQLVIAKPQAASSGGSDAMANRDEGKGKKRGREEQAGEGAEEGKGKKDEVVQKELTRIAVLHTKKERQEQLKTTSWWLPQFQPEAVKEVIAQPPKRPASPMSGAQLRPKDLIPVIFTMDSEKEKTAHISGGDGNRGSIICPVTRKGIISQKAVLIKRCVDPYLCLWCISIGSAFLLSTISIDFERIIFISRCSGCLRHQPRFPAETAQCNGCPPLATQSTKTHATSRNEKDAMLCTP